MTARRWDRIAGAFVVALIAVAVLAPTQALAASSTQAMHRLYNPYVTGGDHHYTTSAEERDSLKDVGWRYEGIGWYSDDAEGTPLYRQYNPYAKTGTHNYTASKEENDHLVSVGWREEGVGWYGVKTVAGPVPGVSDEPARYSYEFYYIDGMGDTWYTGVSRTIFIKTDNPRAGFDFRDADGAEIIQTAIQTFSYADVSTTIWDSNCIKVEGGWLARLALADESATGRRTIILYEEEDPDDYSYATRKFEAARIDINVVSSTAAQQQWADDAIARYTTPDQTPLEKMRSVSRGLRNEFTYRTVMMGEYDYVSVSLAADPDDPYWISKRWDSLRSPSALVVVAERIGGFESARSCYNDYPMSDPQWAAKHYYCEVVYQGEKHYFEACPTVETGEISPSDIKMIDFTNTAQFDRIE